MTILLPHQFKVIGSIISPLGLATWLAGQLGYLTIFLTSWPDSRTLRVGILGSAILAFLFGLFFVAFSKEKTEDEMVQSIRLDSFLFAAFMQIMAILGFFLLAVLLGEPPRSLMELFVVGVILLFWLSYIVRFNYTLHFTHRQWKTQ
jgi:hypothetical protein